MRLPKPIRRARKSLLRWRQCAVPLARATVSGALRLRRAPPRVSAVVVARNDGYFPDYADRIRATVSWNHARLADEVVLVEWNPPADRPLFAPMLVREFSFLRVYVVSPAYHVALGASNHGPMLDYMAKNVGIRRATGDFICATNIDVFFDPAAAFIRTMLGSRYVFRTRRVDFHWDGQPIDARTLRDKRTHLPIETWWRHNFYFGAGDFTLAHRDLWHRAGSYDESIPTQRLHADTHGVMQLQAHGGILVLWGRHFHTYHASSSTAPAAASAEAFDPRANVPYQNSANWGLMDARSEEIEERVWRLEPPLSMREHPGRSGAKSSMHIGRDVDHG